MGFSQQVRDAVLVASARHCSVCRRYVGVKIEVHHIVPRSRGGDDTFENAIALCFDCHADAGHYNPEHPRGTRFSPAELRRHREEWYKLAHAGAIPSSNDPNLIYARHIICRDYGAIGEICAGELSRMPLHGPRLWENHVLQFVRRYHPARAVRKLVVEYASFEAVRHAYPEVAEIEGLRGSGEVRVPISADRVRSVFEESDPLTCELLAEGVPVEELVYSYVYHNQCGTESFYQLADTRPMWLGLLAIENAGQQAVTIEALELREDAPGDLRYRPFATSGASATRSLPPIPLEPGCNVVIPEAIILAPFGGVGFVSSRDQEQQELHRSWVQVLGHGRLECQDPTLLRLVGPALHVERATVIVGGRRVACGVHPLDPSNLYVLDRHWMIGCCPHLFYRGATGWSYDGSILAAPGVGIVVTAQRTLPLGCDSLRIWELEHEVTHIESIRLDGREQLSKPCRLTKGQWIDLPCAGVQELEVSGRYHSEMRASHVHDSYLRMLGQDALAELRALDR